MAGGGRAVPNPVTTKILHDRHGKDSQKWAYYHGKGWVRVGSQRGKVLTAKGIHPIGYGVNNGKHQPLYIYGTGGKKIFPSNNSAGSPTRDNHGPSGSPHGGSTQGNPNNNPDTSNTNPKGPATHTHTHTQTHTQGGGGSTLNAKNFGTFLRDLGNPNVGKMQGPAAATAMANLQFNAQIQQAKQNIVDQGAQASQNQGDISNWYTQLQSLVNSGQANDNRNSDAAQTADKRTTEQLMNMIGGDANAGSGAIAGQGLNSIAGLQMLQQVQQNFTGNENASNAFAETGQKSAQAALDSQTTQQDLSNLTNLQDQRGAAIVANLATFLQQNNALAQQRFANKTSKLETALGAASTVGNLKLQGVQLGQAKAPGGASGNKPWAKLNANERYQLAAQFISGPGGKNVPFAVALARASGAGYGKATGLPQYLHTFY